MYDFLNAWYYGLSRLLLYGQAIYYILLQKFRGNWSGSDNAVALFVLIL